MIKYDDEGNQVEYISHIVEFVRPRAEFRVQYVIYNWDSKSLEIKKRYFRNANYVDSFINKLIK